MQSDDNISTLQQSIQIHLETIKFVHEKANLASEKAAGDMIKAFSSKHPPAEYTIGSEVLVRRFSSKCRKKAGNKSASKATRIVQGTVTDRNVANGTYKIHYKLVDREVDEWVRVSDITSLTLENEKKRHDGIHSEEQPPVTNSPSSSTKEISPQAVEDTDQIAQSPTVQRNSVQSTANMATSEGIYHFHSVRKHYEQYHNLVSKGRLDEDLLFSDSLLRLWRTGADEYLYSSSEDGDCDVSYY